MCKPTSSRSSQQSLLVPSSMITQNNLPSSPNTAALGVVAAIAAPSAVASGDDNDHDDDDLSSSVLLFRQRRQHQQQIRRVEEQRIRQRQTRDARLNELNEYQRFLIFIKIMFKIMEQFNEDIALLKANRIVYQCWNIYKQENFNMKTPTNDDDENNQTKESQDNMAMLQETVTARLREVVNELYWNLTRDYLGYGCD